MRAQDAPPNRESDKSLHLQVLPRPEFNLTPNLVVVRYRRGTERVTENLHLEVRQSQFYISNIRATGESVLRVGYSKKLHKENNASKNVHLEIDCNQLNDESNVVKLSFELLGCSQPIEKQIEIQREIVPEPPKLFVLPTNLNLEITQEREKTHTLTLQKQRRTHVDNPKYRIHRSF